MAGIGKKILSAFVEVTDKETSVNKAEEVKHSSTLNPVVSTDRYADNEKFRQYFEKLFNEANMPGPDYYEFSKMIEAMNGIPDEKARFSAAFAGLQVQGLSKQKLLETAAAYLQVLDKDEANFLSTVDTAVEQKVLAKRKEIEQKTEKVRQLTNEINDLQNQVGVLTNEVKESEQKLAESSDGYKSAMKNIKQRIENEIEKIKSFIN